MWKEYKNTGFFVCENGEVKTVDRYIDSHKGDTKYKRLQKGRLLKGGTTLNGYEFVCIDGENMFRHRLVAELFIPNPHNLPEVNHKDENPHNNSVENLEWISHKDNCNYGRRKSANQDKTKRVAQYDTDGNLVKLYKSLTEAEKLNGTPRGGGIGKCCRNEQKQYLNSKWSYYED